MPKGEGGYPPIPPLKTVFPVEPLIEVIIPNFSAKKKITVSKWRPFENFRFESLSNNPKFEEPLSQKSFFNKNNKNNKITKSGLMGKTL